MSKHLCQNPKYKNSLLIVDMHKGDIDLGQCLLSILQNARNKNIAKLVVALLLINFTKTGLCSTVFSPQQWPPGGKVSVVSGKFSHCLLQFDLLSVLCWCAFYAMRCLLDFSAGILPCNISIHSGPTPSLVKFASTTSFAYMKIRGAMLPITSYFFCHSTSV